MTFYECAIPEYVGKIVQLNSEDNAQLATLLLPNVSVNHSRTSRTKVFELLLFHRRERPAPGKQYSLQVVFNKSYIKTISDMWLSDTCKQKLTMMHSEWHVVIKTYSICIPKIERRFQNFVDAALSRKSLHQKLAKTRHLKTGTWLSELLKLFPVTSESSEHD